MPELLTMQDLANGHLDVKALGEAANGDENTIVTTRTGNTYPSAERAINIMFKNGGLPAIPFATKAKMITDGASLPDDSYAMVTNEKGIDAINNGLYVKTAGAWVKSPYDPKEQAASYTDAKTLQVQGETLEYVNNLNTQLVEVIGKGISDDFRFLGYLSTTSPEVVDAVDGDGYITAEDGLYFGLTVNKGDYLIRKEGRWYVGNAAEVKIQNGNLGAQESVQIRTNKHLTFNGLFNKDGTITQPSTYFYTGFVRVNPTARVEATTGDSYHAIAVAFYDIDFNFLIGYTNRQLPVIAPLSAVYARFCASSVGEQYRGLYTSRSNNTLTFDDFGVKSSLNLATTQNTILDKFLDNKGLIVVGVGWKMLRIPVDAGTTITFGGFTIAISGYYAFADINDTMLKDTLGVFSSLDLPITVTASVSGYLYIDIARPSNTAEHIATLMVNEGNTLLPYEAATKHVVSLRGIDLAGSAIDSTTDITYAEIGGDASFSTLEADSITSSILVLNLPSSDVGLDIGQAWVDPITSSIKVKL